MGILAIESFNAYETARLTQTNNWRVDYFGRRCWTLSPGLRYGSAAVMMTSGVLMAFVIKYDEVASKWSCLGKFTKTAIDMWFPLTLYHIIAALAATGFSRYGLFARRYVPQYQQELEEYLKNEPPHRKDEIEKANLTMLCHRNLSFTANQPWALFGAWLFLAMASDTVSDPLPNFLAVAFALIYCLLDVGQFVVTTPTQADVAWNEIPPSLARTDTGPGVDVDQERGPGKGYIPERIREQMKEQWSRAYRELRKKHRRKTKAQIIDMEMLMAEVDEIRRNLRLLNFPTSRDNIVDEDENNAKERERLFTIPKCVVPVIDEYGYTSLQAVLPTPLELIDPKTETSARLLIRERTRQGDHGMAQGNDYSSIVLKVFVKQENDFVSASLRDGIRHGGPERRLPAALERPEILAVEQPALCLT
ncbi:unnamed protein product [Heligmosomoides polygyrus]|uniref:G_PROTEIN_RECEP_F1_2 domain-containing protein n=1 Tax=Heligmosomoides polygyrus TaxID=6339 RepID=A0A3P7WUR9_HELPZ|nr:unnamed protein product [Heligmosomoides polygyrus]